MLATKMKIKTVQIRIKMTDLCLRIFSSYLTAAGVGSGPLQYQWMVLSVTNFAQVLSSSWVLEKKFSRKANSLISTWGRRLTAKEEERLKFSNKLRNEQLKKNLYTLGRVHTGRVQYAPSRVDGHVLHVPWATHSTVTFQEEVTALPIPI